MNIVMSTDDAFSQYTGIAMLSLLTNKKSGYNINFYILDGGIGENNKTLLKGVVHTRNDCEINFIEIDKNFFKDFPEKGHIKLPSYFRIIAPSIIKSDRLLYLDSDIIVTQDLLDLYLTNLDSYTIAAASDFSEKYIHVNYFRPISRYFNAGVMLIDAKKWRDKNILEKILKTLNDSEKMSKNKFADQDVLNDVLEHDWLELKNIYNFQVIEYEKKIELNDIRILHFIGRIKPWNPLFKNDFSKYYKKYLQISPWKNSTQESSKPSIKNCIIHNIRIYIPRYIPKNILQYLIILKKIIEKNQLFIFTKKK